jgi:hypothetical protein
MRKQDTSRPSAPALAPHLEEIARALRERADAKRPKAPLTYQASIVVRREVTKLARLAEVRRLNSHSTTFVRALTELKNKELPFASQRRGLEGGINVLARWLGITDRMPKPEQKQKKRLPSVKRLKGIRRFRHNGNWLEEYGVEMGDRLLVAMTGDVKPGEVGYVRITKTWGEHSHYHDAFHFIHEVDETCIEWARSGGTICLRNYGNKCMGRHNGEKDDGGQGTVFQALGRVVGVERDRREIETTLSIRPYDEREEPAGTWLQTNPTPVSDKERENLLAAVRQWGPDAVEELLRLVAEGGHSKAEILRRVRKLIKNSPTDARIEELRERLRNLRDEGEAWNESGVFQLEREIYDLEHADTTPADEWPDVIPG